MAAPYPDLSTAGNMTSDLMQFFIYANTITDGWAMFLFVISFYVLVLISSLIIQQRITARIRPDVSFLASSFATLGLATILEQRTGLLNPGYFVILVGLTVVSFVWVIMSSD